MVSYIWLDRPIARLAHDYVHPYDLFAKLIYVPEFIGAVVVLAFAAIGLWALSGRALTKLETVAILSASSLALVAAIKDPLKLAFGRTWPETWTRNNPSFIRDGVYGFHPFHGGPGYVAFPSGHAAAICAVISVLWICYPRFRLLYAICIAVGVLSLVGANFHFLSDVIAGAFLGVSIGWITVLVWERGQHRLRQTGVPSPPDRSDRTPATAELTDIVPNASVTPNESPGALARCELRPRG
jgi:membrane-associated phospholipid phosphatase